MRIGILFLLLFPLAVSAQDLQLVKASRQTVNLGAAPGSVTTYSILLEKKQKFRWQIDSVCSVLQSEKIKYNLVKVDDPDLSSPNYTQVKCFSKNDRGKYLITFGITKNRGSGRPGSPQQMKADTTNIEGGVIIYYSAGKKKKQLKVTEFEMLETVDAP